MNIEEYEQLHPNMVYTTHGGKFAAPTQLRFFTPTQHCAWRVDTLDTKEPDTLEWLAHMRPGQVLYDVGANMGQYSLVAASYGLMVHAFEPESQNFALLMRNITLNDMGDRVTAWPLCLSDEMMLDSFHVQTLAPGGSCSSFGKEVNFHLQPKKYPVHQGSVSIRMDAFAETHQPPDHVKIDVDGLEHLVVSGMTGILSTVQSVLVEINSALPQHMLIIEVMAAHGLIADNETADIARRKEGAFKGIGNVIFYRGGKP